MSATDLHELVSDEATHTVEYEYDTETPASIMICVLKDVDPVQAPTELGFVLHDHIDPSALDTILADGTGNGDTAVSFEISNGDTYLVDVANDDRIKVQQLS